MEQGVSFLYCALLIVAPPSHVLNEGITMAALLGTTLLTLPWLHLAVQKANQASQASSKSSQSYDSKLV